MDDQVKVTTAGPAGLVASTVAFLATLVASIALFLAFGGGGTEDDMSEWARIAPIVAGLGILVALGLSRAIGLRLVAWSVFGAALIALLCNLALAWLVANLPSG